MKTPATLAEAEAQQEEFLHGIATMFVKAGHGDRAKALALIDRVKAHVWHGICVNDLCGDPACRGCRAY